jgi:hypothetical protein
MARKKENPPVKAEPDDDKSVLKTAAEAIGSTLGTIVAKTGLAQAGRAKIGKLPKKNKQRLPRKAKKRLKKKTKAA